MCTRTSSERSDLLQSLCFRKLPVCNINNRHFCLYLRWKPCLDETDLRRDDDITSYPGSFQAANPLMEGGGCFQSCEKVIKMELFLHAIIPKQLDFFWFSVASQVSNPRLFYPILGTHFADLYPAVYWRVRIGPSTFTDSGLFVQ